MLHLGNGPFRDVLEPLIARSLHTVQSTSVSGVLLASLDLTRQSLATNPRRVGESIKIAEAIRDEVRARGRFRVASDEFTRFPDVAAIDPLRVAIDTRAGGISGHDARALLISEHRIYVEVATESAIVLVIGAGSAPDSGRVVSVLHSLGGYVRGSVARVTRFRVVRDDDATDTPRPAG
jgi:arginine/lysine/ornithine decarboxylase